MKTLVLAFVDNTGLRLTGRYLDRYCQKPESEAVPEARAAIWSDYTKARLAQLKAHIAQESSAHVWMGYFVLADTDDILAVARAKALEQVSLGRRRAVTGS
jgi:hypothetical protein